MGCDRSWVVRITTVELRCSAGGFCCVDLLCGFAVWICCVDLLWDVKIVRILDFAL